MRTNPRRRRGSGSLGELKAAIWTVIFYNRGVVEDDDLDHELRQRAGNALVQAALAYAKVMELYDLEREVKTLEQRTASNGHHPA
jgi:hypothetical protein